MLYFETSSYWTRSEFFPESNYSKGIESIILEMIESYLQNLLFATINLTDVSILNPRKALSVNNSEIFKDQESRFSSQLRSMTGDISVSSRSSYKNIGNTIKLSNTFSSQTLNAPSHPHQSQQLEKSKSFEHNSCSCH